MDGFVSVMIGPTSHGPWHSSKTTDMVRPDALVRVDRLRVSGEVPRGEKMFYPGTDPESYITDYTLVYEDVIGPTSHGPWHSSKTTDMVSITPEP